MAFFQTAPKLGNQHDDDALLREHLARTLPDDMRREIEPELRHLGGRAGGDLYELQQRDRLNEPTLTSYDPYGRRIDEVRVTAVWDEGARLAAEHGLVATAYEKAHGAHSRTHQFAKVYLVGESLDVYTCPLAMTDGAARTLTDLGNAALRDRAVPRLTSRDPKTAWTSGQWMTERTGGSDVGLTETVAKRDGDRFRLHGAKWFTSAITSQMALTLARPEGNDAGGRGLALFYVETRDASGALTVRVNRLKDKLGTRKVPTAELDLEGTPADAVAGLTDGVRNISPMLNLTRTWNAIGAVAGMRRALALSKDFAARRFQFGANLVDKPLHADTLAGMQAEFEGAFLLAFRAAELLGRRENGEGDDAEERLARALIPLAKLTTGKQVVAIASEALECFGGAGYVEDTGLPRVLRDAQVLPIWEGTTNVLSLETLKALSREGAPEALVGDAERRLASATDGSLAAPVRAARSAFEHARAWLTSRTNPATTEAGARRLALTLGRALELTLLCEHAQWCLANGRGPRAAAAARRLALHGVDLLAEHAGDDAGLLARG